jgi:AbrB family looped-hinge helix DNA binding protein
VTKSTLTAKYQTTIPKEVREKLRAEPGDVLHWEMAGDHARVTVAPRDFLSLKGRFKVGPGDPVEDVHRARDLIGIRYR